MFLDHLSRTVRGRSRTVSRPLVLASAAVLSLTPLAIAAPAGAAPAAQPSSVNLFSGLAQFHVGGHTWLMSVSATGGLSGSAGFNVSTVHEFDTWNFFSVPKSDLTANARSGVATFKTHNSLAPVAFANLRFTPRSRHKVVCRSGSRTEFAGKVTGSVSLAAGRTATFKSAHVTFRGASLVVDHNCKLPPAGALPCSGGFWSAGGIAAATGDGLGLPGQRRFSVSVAKSVTLSAPKLASVTFAVSGAERKPVFDSTRKRFSVKAIRVVKGSAVLAAAGPPIVHRSPCTLNHKRFRSRDTLYPSTYKSPASGQFEARSILGGLLKVARSGIAFFDIVTLKRA